MQDNETTEIETERWHFPVLLIVALAWAIWGTALWSLGFLSISVAWILGPIAYLAHMNFEYALVRKAVKAEVAKLVEEVEYDIKDMAVVSFEDATHMEGKLN